MKKFLTALLLLVLLGGAVGAMWHFTDGFKDWSFKKKPNDPIIAEKHIEKTIIENETYGTFELPKSAIKTNNLGVVFQEGTNVSYLVEDIINVFNTYGMDNDYSIDTAKIGFNSGFFQYVVDSEQSRISGINVFKNNVVHYRGDNTPANMASESLLIFDEATNQSDSAIFFVYVKEGEYYDAEANMTMWAPEVIISDKGCPLTDVIYRKLMQDESTKITHVYNDGIEAPNLPQIESKEIIKSIIFTEKYGIFEIAGDYKSLKMTSAQNVVYQNNTALSYMLSEAVNLVNSINGTNYTTDNVKIGFIGNENVGNVGVTHINLAEIDGRTIYEFAASNKVVLYQDGELKKELQKEANLQVVFVDLENQKYYKFANNVYVKDYTYETADGETKVLSELIVSDSNIPLTESIFNEILQDETTKITYVYKGRDNG